MDFQNYIQRINRYLAQYLSNQGGLTEAIRYSVLSNGKRFRPILTYTTANLFATDLRLADSSACAVEFVHAYSLIHDDLPAMDDDDIRHNQPACHKQFGEAQAILAGDGLQTLAFEVLSRDNLLSADVRIALIQTLAHAAFEMAEGQAIDLSVVSQVIDIDTLENIHQKKTGVLLSCATKLGTLVSPKCADEDRQILADFSKTIGLAYQIQDDVLDVLTTEDVLGKKQNSDADKGKPTYPSLLGLDEATKIYQRLYVQAFESLQGLSVNANELQILTQKLQVRKF